MWLPGKEFGRAALAARGARCLGHGCCKPNAEPYFRFSSFVVKVKIFFGFLEVGKKTGTSGGLFLKAKWHNANFQKVGGRKPGQVEAPDGLAGPAL